MFDFQNYGTLFSVFLSEACYLMVRLLRSHSYLSCSVEDREGINSFHSLCFLLRGWRLSSWIYKIFTSSFNVRENILLILNIRGDADIDDVLIRTLEFWIPSFYVFLEPSEDECYIDKAII